MTIGDFINSCMTDCFYLRIVYVTDCMDCMECKNMEVCMPYDPECDMCCRERGLFGEISDDLKKFTITQWVNIDESEFLVIIDPDEFNIAEDSEK